MKRKILVVEDESAIADNILYALSTEGFETRWVTTGREALQLVEKEPFDLVVLDVGLPDTSGFDVARALLARRNLPLIFLTARAAEIDRVVGLEIGADDYVVKPFSPRELSARVKAVLRRSAAPAATAAPGHPAELRQIGPFLLDEKRCRLTYHEVVLDLSRTELRLITALLNEPGRVFTRSQLMDLAWDEPGHSLDRTVDAHVKTLRQKLKAVRPEDDPIVTHRGIGYSLEEPA